MSDIAKKVFKIDLKFKFIITCIFIISAQMVSATEQLNNRNITVFMAYNNFVMLGISTPSTNQDGCTGNTSRVVIDLTKEGSENLLTTALAAKLSGNKVSIAVNKCYARGATTYHSVYRVTIL